MHEQKIAEYRAAAAQCGKWANQESDEKTKLRWQTMVDEWSRMAEALEGKIRRRNPQTISDGTKTPAPELDP